MLVVILVFYKVLFANGCYGLYKLNGKVKFYWMMFFISFIFEGFKLVV